MIQLTYQMILKLQTHTTKWNEYIYRVTICKIV